MVAVTQSALAQNSVMAQNLVRFSGGVGVIPTGSVNTTVRGVVAAGQIWMIRDLAADVKAGREDPTRRPGRPSGLRQCSRKQRQRFRDPVLRK